MSASQRAKGRRGENEARDLLTERDWTVVETQAGRACEDLFAVSPDGKAYAVEVKHHEAPTIRAFRKQAKEQARKRKSGYLLMVRWPGIAGCFAVEGTNIDPTFWRKR